MAAQVRNDAQGACADTENIILQDFVKHIVIEFFWTSFEFI
jgi:hypothetical protein